MNALARVLWVVVAVELAAGAWLVVDRLRHPAPPASALVHFAARGPFGEDLPRLWPQTHGRAAAENSFGAWIDLTGLYLSVGYYPEAEVTCRHACSLDPDSYDARFTLGVCLDLLGRPADAVPVLERAAALAGVRRDAHAHFLIGRNLLKLEQPDAAVAAFEKARDYPPVAYHLARLLLRLGRRPAADRAVEDVARLLPDSFEAFDLAAQLAALDGDAAKERELHARADAAPQSARYNPVREVVRGFRVAYEKSRGVESPESYGWAGGRR